MQHICDAHPHYVCQKSVPFRCLVIFHCVVFSFAHGHLGCFLVWAIMDEAAMNIHKQVMYGYGFSFLLGKKKSRSGIAGLKDRYMINFIGN